MRLRPGRALILLASALVLGFVARSEGKAVFVSRTVWSMDDPGFGGWSGLEVSEDGQTFTAVADRGWITEGRFLRSGAGRIADVRAAPPRRLDDTDKGFFGRETRDAEGLARSTAGRVFVSFEAVRRIVSYPDASGHAPEVLPIYRDFIGMRPNMSLEALAIDEDGALYTLPETSRGHRSISVYRFDEGGWTTFATLPRSQRHFSQVGADIGPDGRFYLLERRFSPRIGFATRVRRFDIDDNGFSRETVLLETRLGTHDNLEGLAVWRDRAGRIRLTMVSDDNLGRWQDTEFVEYLVAD